MEEENIKIRQISLVAFYGEKDLDNIFWKHIENIQNILGKNLNDDYQRYQSKQIHGTIIGLEAAQFDSSLIGKNFLENQNKIVRLDLSSILDYIYNSDLLPFEIKVGGFENKDEVFTSRGLLPFQRSFFIQSDTVVTMGWPFKENTYMPVLDTLRRRLSYYGALHKYHTAPDSYDNDFFFVLGNLAKPLTKKVSEDLQELVQNEMQSWKGTNIKLTKNDLGIVAYKGTRLKDAKFFSLKEAMNCMDELRNFYPKYENAIKNNDWLE
jgi:hypothetical protein